MLKDDTGQYSCRFGSKVKGKDLVRLSVGITAIVSVFIPFTTLSFMAVVLIFNESIELVIFGSFVPYSVFVTSFFFKSNEVSKICSTQIKLIITINRYQYSICGENKSQIN